MTEDNLSKILADIKGEGLGEEQGARRPNQLQGRTDYAAYRVTDQDKWDETCEEDQDFPSIIRIILNSSILFPRKFQQEPLAFAYLMLPSALCTRLPVLYSHGESGSGKSTIAIISAGIHDTDMFGGSSSPTSIRNAISSGRRHIEDMPLDVPGNERHFALSWEDIHSGALALEEGKIFVTLKNGCERTGIVTTANMAGGLNKYHVFCPKLMSSVHPIYAESRYRELVRRVIVLQHKKTIHWNENDLEGWDGLPSTTGLLNVQGVNWEGCRTAFESFWSDQMQLAQWADYSKKLGKKTPNSIEPGNWKMSRELVVCGLTVGAWAEIEDAIECIRRYWQWHEINVTNQASALRQSLQRFIDHEISEIIQRNEAFIAQGMKQFVTEVSISPKAVKSFVDGMRAEGELDTAGNVFDVASEMGALGWGLSPDATGRNKWFRSVK